MFQSQEQRTGMIIYRKINLHLQLDMKSIFLEWMFWLHSSSLLFMLSENMFEKITVNILCNELTERVLVYIVFLI